MVVTDKFVYIHMPKTGGTFVTEVLTRLHSPDAPPGGSGLLANVLRLVGRDSGIRAVTLKDRYGPLANLEPKHGTCHEIPEVHRKKPILSVMRSPYDWYVSQYEFAWWKRTFTYHPEPNPTPVGYAIEQVLPAFVQLHPHFPEISFEEFIDLCGQASGVYNSTARSELGLFSHGFIRFYYKDVENALARIDRNDSKPGSHQSDMFDVHFIKTNRLNDGLYQYLLSKDYRRADLAFIRGLGKVLPMGRGRQEDQNWERYYTPGLKKKVREQDWMLFQLFPEFDV